ncbi:MAG TPA: GNAT family N-acetyltransferase [Puia sp.]|nr:GNAT family N-acetyltransferase [Puia sp.]
MDWQKDEFTISTDSQRLDIPYIHAWLSGRSYWAEGIPVETVRASVEGSLCFGIYHGEKQVGFSRVITDKATFGYLADVFIDENYRKRGLSKWMMEIILAHPELQGFRRWMLATLDAHGLYTQFGFLPIEEPDRLMAKNSPDVYRKKD